MDIHRILIPGDTLKAGDEAYVPERNNWERVAKESYGLPYEPSNITPIRRRVHVPKELEIKDVPADKPDELKWNFAEMTKPCHVLVSQQNGITDILFDPNNMSPSKEYVCIHLAEGDGHIWMRLKDLEKLTIEIIDGDELPGK